MGLLLSLATVAAGVSLAACDGSEVEPLENVTWYGDIQPIVVAHCQSCHTDGGISPFSLDDYQQAKKWGPAMLASIEDGIMPPWGAVETEECVPPGSFKDDLRLSEGEKELFRAWVEAKMPEGDPNSAATLPEPPSLVLTSPSASLTIGSAVTVSGRSDSFECFVLDPGNEEDVWITETQVTPGNSKIVHHVLVYQDPSGESEALVEEDGHYSCFGGPGVSSPSLLAAWAPGAGPTRLPAATGLPLRKGTKLILQVHYHPTASGPETDEATSVELKWETVEPANVAAVYLIGNFSRDGELVAGGAGYGLLPGEGDPDSGAAFVIPAGAENHEENQRFLVPGVPGFPLRLWAVGTHMHYVGTDMKIAQARPDGETQCLVQTPAWDFNWQRGYFFEGAMEDLPIVYTGDVLEMRCRYDNSMNNRFVREALDDEGLDAPRDVTLGEATLDEMCLGLFGVAVPKAFAGDL